MPHNCHSLQHFRFPIELVLIVLRHFLHLMMNVHLSVLGNIFQDVPLLHTLHIIAILTSTCNVGSWLWLGIFYISIFFLVFDLYLILLLQHMHLGPGLSHLKNIFEHIAQYRCLPVSYLCLFAFLKFLHTVWHVHVICSATPCALPDDVRSSCKACTRRCSSACYSPSIAVTKLRVVLVHVVFCVDTWLKLFYFIQQQTYGYGKKCIRHNDCKKYKDVVKKLTQA